MNWEIYGWFALVFAVIGGSSSVRAKDAYDRIGISPHSDPNGSFLRGAILGMLLAIPYALLFGQ